MKLYLDSSSNSQYYNLLGLVGTGKSSVQVYKAQSPGDSKLYAVKIFTHSKGEASQYFLREKEVAGSLDHPHILKYFDFFEKACFKSPRLHTKQCSAIIMEYIPYGDLFGLIAKEPFSEKLARTFFKQMLDALQYLHDQDIAHLDLKPENFLIDAKGAKLIDFDFSHNIGRRSCEGIKGTPGYRPPELASGHLVDSKKSDIYSLGVVLFTMVAGCPPYEEAEIGIDKFEFDKFYQAFQKNRTLFWESHNNFKRQAGDELFSEEFKEIIEAMMDTQPEKRPSVDEIKEMSWFKDEIFEPSELQARLKKNFE